MKVSKKIAVIADRVKAIGLKDKSRVFNTARIEALEVEKPDRGRAGNHGVRGGAARMPWRPHRQ
jgi:hypothetical protein